MKKIFYSLSATFLFLFFVNTAFSQDVDEIINNYFENTGGVDNWKKLEGVKISAKVNQGGMEIPLEIVQTKGGKQYTKISVQGMTLMQNVFDGEVLWGTNMQTMGAEKMDAETTEIFKKQNKHFPDPFLDYKENGYKVELMGKETVDGAETLKVKLTMDPITVDGQETENVIYYFFDEEAFIPIALESEVKVGPQKGVVQMIKFSDYQEVDGLMFAFSMSVGIKDGPSQAMTFDAVELNPEVDASMFAMPSGE